MEGSQLIVPENSISTVTGNFSHSGTSITGEDNDDLALKVLSMISQIWNISSCLQIVLLIYLP